MTNALVVINPNASKGKGEVKAKRISEYFKEAGWNCTVAYTQGEGHAEKLAKSGAENGFKTIIAAGGDGTVNEVVNGIMRSNKNVDMGIIPVGRGNDFAWIAGIPTDWKKASDIIIKGTPIKTDVGYAKGTDVDKYFLNGMGFGFEPMVNFRAQEYKHLNGMASYVAAFISILMNSPKGYEVSMSLDGGETRNFKTQQISMNNGRRMGSSFLMTPRAEIDDGLLDFMFTNRLYKGFGLIGLVLKFFKGAMVSDKENFSYGNAKHVVIDVFGQGAVSHVDGEEFERAGNHFEIDILPSAVSLYRPGKGK